MIYFFIWEHGEDYLKQFIEKLNDFHPSIKFTRKWSRKKLNVDIRVRKRKLKIEAHMKPTGNRQLHDPISLSPIPEKCKKNASTKDKFDQRCNDLEKWLMERGWMEERLECRFSKKEVNLAIPFLSEGIPKLQRVNLLLRSFTVKRFRMSEIYCRNFKFC